MKELETTKRIYGKNANDYKFIEALSEKGYNVFERYYWSNGSANYKCWCISLIGNNSLNPCYNYEGNFEDSNYLIWLETVDYNDNIKSKLQHEVIEELKRKREFFKQKEEMVNEFLEDDENNMTERELS